MRQFKPERIPPPPDLECPWSENFELEIGGGTGLHAIRYALAHPERRLLAIERTENKFASLARRAFHHDLPNLRVRRVDALPFVTHVVPENRLLRVFLLYPNPYPKPKHANQRWYNMPFMAHLRAKMAPGAELILATNLEWYARGARAQLPEQFGFELSSEREITRADSYRTHFEKKYLARGQTCFDLVFRKP